MRSAIYKIQSDLDIFVISPHANNLSSSSYVLFDTVPILLETFFDNIGNKGDISGGKI
jgi:hypothetical protein